MKINEVLQQAREQGQEIITVQKNGYKLCVIGSPSQETCKKANKVWREVTERIIKEEMIQQRSKLD